MGLLEGKTIIITGASRGIGKALAIKFASEGANIVAAAKTMKPHPKLAGTLPETVAEIKKAGGNAIAVKVDVSHATKVNEMVNKAVEVFGGIDMLVNNAGAISLTNVEKTSLKLYDRMHSVNDRAVFLCSQAVIPFLKKSKQAHILTLSPPINLKPKWLKSYSPYTASKYSMSMLSLGMAEELKEFGISVNCLWPKTTIATAAIEFAVGGKEMLNISRTTNIMADAALEIIKTDKCTLTGNLFIDEEILRSNGETNFDKYAYNDKFKDQLYTDLFIDE